MSVDLELAVPGTTTRVRVGRGLLLRLPELIAAEVPAAAYVVIADATVATLYGEAVASRLREAGHATGLLRFRAGEDHKTPTTWAELLEGVAGLGVGRDGCVVAVGGGVTGDLAGFVAATYARGIPVVQVPTSLLAMIDASIGGKTGVDLRAGKNLAGAFHHPRLVVADPKVLATLPGAELRAGLAEAVKHGVVSDAEYFETVASEAAALLRLEPEPMERLVSGSVRIKAGVVGRDAGEAGERAVLNFGHTVGHALELLTSFRTRHGFAVAMGMVAEARIGEEAGITEPGTAERIAAVLQALDLPVAFPVGISPDALVEAMASDKKARDGRVRYALPRRIGEIARTDEGEWTHAVPTESAMAALASGV